MKLEISAGGIVVRKTTHGWEVLLIQDMNDALTFPKGHLEKDETHEIAAAREIWEEVGLSQLKLLRSLLPVRYTFKKNGVIKKTVHYFLFECTKPQKLVNQTAEGIHNAAWMRIDEALSIIGYPETNKPLLQKVQAYLS